MDRLGGPGLREREVTITGRLASMSRDEAVRAIEAAGGRHKSVPGSATDFLVLGGDGAPIAPDGQPTHAIRRAQELIARGFAIQILEEADFLSLLRPRARSTDPAQTFTLAQLARMLDVPPARIRGWVRMKLLAPLRVEKRLCFFSFAHIAQARRLQQLTDAGITADRIRKSLDAISTWAQAEHPQPKPEALESLTRLEVANRSGLLAFRRDDGRLTDPHGQLLLEFDTATADQPQDRAPRRMRPRQETAEEWFRIGIAAEESGEYDSAIEAYERALTLGEPQPEVCFNLGNTYYAMDRNTEAAACFRRATQIDPEYVEAYNNLGNALAGLGKHDEAIPAYRRALAISPQYADAHYNLAETLARTGDLDRAREHWHAYLRQDPNSQWASMVRERLAELS